MRNDRYVSEQFEAVDVDTDSSNETPVVLTIKPHVRGSILLLSIDQEDEEGEPERLGAVELDEEAVRSLVAYLNHQLDG